MDNINEIICKQCGKSVSGVYALPALGICTSCDIDNAAKQASMESIRTAEKKMEKENRKPHSKKPMKDVLLKTYGNTGEANLDKELLLQEGGIKSVIQAIGGAMPYSNLGLENQLYVLEKDVARAIEILNARKQPPLKR